MQWLIYDLLNILLVVIITIRAKLLKPDRLDRNAISLS